MDTDINSHAYETVMESYPNTVYWMPTRKKLLYTVANPARGLLNREKNKIKSLAVYPPPPHPHHCSFGEKKNITRRIYRRYAGLGRSRVSTMISSAHRLGTRPTGVVLQNSNTFLWVILRFTRFEHAQYDYEEVECLCCPIMPALSAM